jgi:NAD-dependent SIR2 family protein deacetylase
VDAWEDAAARAATIVSAADALLVTAGAGMGVDSGLPDFRGDAGFWKAYPAYAHLGLSFVDLANPRWFDDDAPLAWGFYGHRLNLYRATRPHPGFALLRGWGAARRDGVFVFTSNVDGQFQRAGFDPERIVECHGTIETWQCTRDCGVGLFPASLQEIGVDANTLRAANPLPRCTGCGVLARPNVLMFGDDGWDDRRTGEQRRRFERWLAGLEAGRRRLAIVECGAGTAVPTVRRLGEALAGRLGATLIRINVREPDARGAAIAIPLGAHEALAAIGRRIDEAAAQY